MSRKHPGLPTVAGYAYSTRTRTNSTVFAASCVTSRAGPGLSATVLSSFPCKRESIWAPRLASRRKDIDSRLRENDGTNGDTYNSRRSAIRVLAGSRLNIPPENEFVPIRRSAVQNGQYGLATCFPASVQQPIVLVHILDAAGVDHS